MKIEPMHSDTGALDVHFQTRQAHERMSSCIHVCTLGQLHQC